MGWLIDKKRLRETGLRLLGIAFETGAALMVLKAAWFAVAALVIVGLVLLIFGYLPELREVLARRGSEGSTLPGTISYLETAPDGSMRLHLPDKWRHHFTLLSWASWILIAIAVIFVGYTTWEFQSPALGLPIGPQLGTFQPPAWVMKNSDGSPRIFIRETITHLIGRYRDQTDLQAAESSKPFLGKWVAISGTVAEIKPTFGDVTVRLSEGTVPPVFPTFSGPQIADLQVYSPGDRIKMVCKIAELNGHFLLLKNCQVVP